MSEKSRRSPLPYSRTCFVCGDANERGLQVRFYLQGEGVATVFTPERDLEGYPGRIHGGILAALLDETMGWAPCVKYGRFCVAAELTVRYLQAVPAGTMLTIYGEAIGSQRRLWEAEGEVRGQDGTVYARGRGKYFPLSQEETDAVMQILHVEGKQMSLADAIELARTSGRP